MQLVRAAALRLRPRGQVGLSYGALGHDVYDGTSGIALFLAGLRALTGDEAFHRASLGAIGQALVAAEDPASATTLGLYTGSMGIAFAAASVGILLSERSLLERARHLARRAAAAPASPYEFDLLSGRAGAVAALLVLHELCDDHVLLDAAVRLGDELIAHAERAPWGWSWASGDRLSHPNLTGLSHGTAGAGHALSDEVRNWPDFREESGRRPEGRASMSYRTQWCHGAAGIALTRLRAYELIGDELLRREAMTALATTMQDTAKAQRGGSLSFCLCHGLGGNADVLLEGRAMLPESGSGDGLLAEEIGTVGMESYGTRGRPWPCGIPVPGRETPGLMLGLAGIGYFYLRLTFPDQVPSLLLPRRGNFTRRLKALAAGHSGVLLEAGTS